MKKMKILMLGPARNVKGGMTTVVDGYFDAGLEKKVELKFIETVNDKNSISKILKMIVGFLEFLVSFYKYDVIHIHMASRLSSFRKGLYVRIAKKFKKKVILHIHGAEYKIFYDNECTENKKKYVKKTLELSDKIIVLSEEWKEYFKKLVNESKIIVLYNAIVIPNEFKKDFESKNILFLGRIGERKGIFDLLKVIKELINDYQDIKLYVGGDGEVERLKKFILDNKLEKNVEYIGWTAGEKKDSYLRNSSIYILPSYNEGMPMSVLEGMAYINATISTYVGGVPKIIQNKKNGFLIQPGDTVKLKFYLTELFDNLKLKKELAENARITIEEKFNIKKNIEKLIEIYKS